MWPNLSKTADLVTFTEEILHGKLHFLCSDFTKNTHPYTITSQSKIKVWLGKTFKVLQS